MTMSNEIKCVVCGETTKRTGTNQKYCKKCKILVRNKWKRDWAKENRDKVNKYNEQWKKDNSQYHKDYHKRTYPEQKEKIQKKAKEWYRKNYREIRGKILLRKFGIDLSIYNQMKEFNNNKCYICGLSETTKTVKGKIKDLSVDHCHETGEVRGLLCDKCNHLVGLSNENPFILIKTVEYLKSGGYYNDFQ